ncbi:SusC/RagA family TonB-linked outer membrane protein [Sphingobacterium puteale]|uniref:SusC/RagA family TonB-linked outer membrane protein n=2 Tax=Sphingobacterium puteale TaxID=2420510 RepID=A0A420VVI1_9SPHI|nr:SusC/RagA family TonB-linked outer membrane protein [Sphingobacterium puteale]
MKLHILLLVFISLQVHAGAYSQEINMKIKNGQLKVVMQQLSKQSGYDFLYEETYLKVARPVTLEAKNMDVRKALATIFRDQPFSYTIRGKMIILKPRDIKPANPGVTSQRSIKGIVHDVNNAPLQGVNISLSGGAPIAASNEKGQFEIVDLKGQTELLFHLIGYEEKRISVGDQTFLDVSLSATMNSLDEVVVVGYGVQMKSNVVGAVSTVKSEQIARKPVTNLAEALTGETPGLTIAQSSSQPGTVNTSLRIRGEGTWGNSSPLVLVDGVAMNMFDVMPSDVESVTVLKDASAAAIYGSRAANGVILVTTKSGKSGKLAINYNGSIGQQYATRIPKPVSSWQYAEMYNKVTENLTGVPGTTFSQEKIDRMKNGGDPDVLEGNTNWYKELIKPATQTMHNLTMQNGSDKTTYLGSLGYTKQNGVINSTYERYNMRLNTSTKFNSWLKVGANMSYINDERKESANGAASSYYYVPRSMPYYPVKYSDGTWSFLSAPQNAVRRSTYDYGMMSMRGDKLSMLVSPEISPISGLLIKGTFGYENKSFLQKRSTKIVKYDSFAPANQVENTVIARNSQSDTYTQERNLTGFLTATYNKQIAAHHFVLMGGVSAESTRYSSLQGDRKDFPNNDFSEISSGDINTSLTYGSSYYQSLASMFGRFNYNYDNKYLFEANIRRDGSSKFARGNKWGTFPSFSLGWRMSEEKFFENLKPVIPEFKLRSSWGKLGNNQIDNFLFLSTYGAGESYIFGSNLESSFYEAVMGNNVITWETTTHKNLGLDLAAIKGKLSFSFDWFNRVTDNILLNLDAPSLLGITAPIQNAGSVQNRGWEISFGWRDKIGSEFKYNISANLSDVRNKVLDLKGYKSSTTALTTRIEGEPLNSLFGWETLGIATDQAKYDQYSAVMKTFIPTWSIGDIIVKDRNGDGQITAADKTIIGNTIPRYTYGVTLSGEYKKFDFSLLFQGVGKRDGFLGRDVIEPMGIFSALEEHFLESFDPTNPNPNAYYPRLLGAAQRQNWQNYSHWVQDASYLRLKNISVGYSFGIPKAKIKNIRTYFSGQNILTFTKYRIFDPENGLNSISFPNVATYTLGLNIDF